MTYEEAKLLLKRSNLSLTVLKPSVSTTSSQPSLPQNTDDEKVELNSNEKIFDDLPKLFTSSNVPQLLPPVNPHHIRNSSAPLHITSPTDHLLTNHNRSISGIGQMSDDELNKISADLFVEVQRRKDDESKRKTLGFCEESKLRNSSFIVAMKTDQVHSSLPLQPIYPLENIITPFRRPMSAHSSKQSVSSGSTGRYSHDINRIAPSSPRTFCHSDPLCLDPKTIGQVTGSVNSNTPVNCRSSHGKRRKQFTVSRSFITNPQVSIPELVQHRLSNFNHHPSSADGISTQKHSLKEHLQNIGPSTAGVFDNRHYGTFPGKPARVTTEVTERYNSRSSMNTSKPSSNLSFGSHGSFNSSEFSDKGTSILGHIEPVHEETLDSLLEFSSQKGISNSARSSGRSLGPISPRSSGRSSRQRSSTSPNYSRSRKSPKVQRNKSPL